MCFGVIKLISKNDNDQKFYVNGGTLKVPMICFCWSSAQIFQFFRRRIDNGSQFSIRGDLNPDLLVGGEGYQLCFVVECIGCPSIDCQAGEVVDKMIFLSCLAFQGWAEIYWWLTSDLVGVPILLLYGVFDTLLLRKKEAGSQLHSRAEGPIRQRVHLANQLLCFGSDYFECIHGNQLICIQPYLTKKTMKHTFIDLRVRVIKTYYSYSNDDVLIRWTKT